MWRRRLRNAAQRSTTRFRVKWAFSFPIRDGHLAHVRNARYTSRCPRGEAGDVRIHHRP